MDVKKIESLFEVLNQLLEIEGNADEETVGPLIQKMYLEMVSKYRPVMQVLPDVAEIATQDLVPIVMTFLTVVNGIHEDDDIRTAVDRRNVLKADMRKMALDTYQSAGFSREEAMALLLQDVANAKAHLYNVGNNLTSSSSKSN